jgi:acyl transferase domain-containing protein
MSLVGNGQGEAARFAPGLRVYPHHGGARLHGDVLRDHLKNTDLVVTTYATASRDIDELAGYGWNRVVLDEAQAVKNSLSRAAKAVRRLRLGEFVHLAAINGPSVTVVAGHDQALDELIAACHADGIQARRIDVDYPSHTAGMAALEDRLLADLNSIHPRTPDVPLYSTVTGELLTARMDAQYWYDNIRHIVRFGPAVQALLDTGHGVFIEVSPHPVMTVGISELGRSATVLGTLRRDSGGLGQFLSSAVSAYAAGVRVRWQSLLPHARTIELPTYQFDRSRYWLAAPAAAACTPGAVLSAHPLLGGEIELPGGGTLYTGRLSVDAHPWLSEHVVAHAAILPGTVFIDLALHAVGRLEELTIERPLRQSAPPATPTSACPWNRPVPAAGP